LSFENVANFIHVVVKTVTNQSCVYEEMKSRLIWGVLANISLKIFFQSPS